MIKIIADSTSYVPRDLIEKYNIEIVPLSVILGEEIIVETQISNEDFFKKLDASHFHPTSSQPPLGLITDVFRKHAKQEDDVIFITISSEMSGTYSTALVAKNQILEEYPQARIEVIDSGSNCMDFGFPVINGGKAVAAGRSFEETISIINDNISKCRMLFIPKTLKYLQKSGRLSKANALAASVLKIVPILTVNEMKADVFAKIRTREKALRTILNEFYKDVDNDNVADVSVIHINNEEEAKNLLAALKEKLNMEVLLSSIGPVIGAHVGPGALGLVWCTKRSNAF